MTTDTTLTTLETLAYGLMQDIAQLAPHPDHPNQRGPVFTSGADAYAPASDSEGMIGLLGAEMVLGPIFSAAVSSSFGSFLGQIDFSNTLGTISDYLSDRNHSNKNKKNSRKNTYTDPWQRTSRKSFNLMAGTNPARRAFLRDLPKRKTIEGRLAETLRQISLRKAQLAMTRPTANFAPAALAA